MKKEEVKELELYRKIWHISFIWAPIAYYFFIDRTWGIILAAIFLVFFIILDVLRIFVIKRGNEIAFKHFWWLIRERERHGVNAAVYFSLAALICAFFFEKRVTVLAITLLCLGDPIAALVGTKYGTIRILNKSLEGSVACFVACFVAGLVLFNFVIALAAALTATLFELISSRINDNLSVPIFSGLTVTLLLRENVTDPLRVVYVIFEVYLIFVAITSIAGVFLKHYMMSHYRRNYDSSFEPSERRPKVSIIKPVRGAEPRMYRNFASFCRQDYDGEYEILFAMQDTDDPAFGIVENLKREFPDHRINIILAGVNRLLTQKMNNIVHAVHAASGEVLVMSDSPASVEPDYLASVVAPLGDEKIGIVTAMASYFGARNIPAALNSLLINIMGTLLYIPLAFFEKLYSANGCTLAIRRETLEEVGGIDSFTDQISDVHAISNTVFKAGYRVHLLNRPVRIYHPSITWKEWIQKTHRMSVTIRTYIPNLYPLFIFQAGLIHALIYLALNPYSPWARLLVGLTIIADMVSHIRVNYIYLKDRNTYFFIWLLPVLMLAAPFLWLTPYFTKVVQWREERYFIDSGGVATRLKIGA